MNNQLIYFSALLLASLFGQGLCVCQLDSDYTPGNEAFEELCYKLFQQFEGALNADQTNSYRLRKAFFYAPNARPV